MNRSLQLALGLGPVRWIPRGLARLILWLGVLTIILASSTLVARADDGEEPVWAVPLAPPIEPCPPASSARGLFFIQAQQVQIPYTLPVGTRLVLAGSPDGTGELSTDDQAIVSIVPSMGQVRELRLDFRLANRQEVVPLPPLDLTEVLGKGPITIRLELWDLVPPTCSSSPYYLVGLAPARHEAGEAAPIIGASTLTAVATAGSGPKQENAGEANPSDLVASLSLKAMPTETGSTPEVGTEGEAPSPEPGPTLKADQEGAMGWLPWLVGGAASLVLLVVGGKGFQVFLGDRVKRSADRFTGPV